MHPMSNASRPRQRALLGVGLVVLVVGAVAIYIWLAAQSAEPTFASGMITARQALPAAAETATQWQKDARLVSASAQWLETSAQQNGKSIEWSFQFFSSATQQLVIINVHDGAASQVSSFYAAPMTTFSTNEWQVDSDRAWAVWLDNGGRRMLDRYPDATLAMTLRVPSEGERPVWQVAGVVVSNRSTLIVMVDAADGTVLE